MPYLPTAQAWLQTSTLLISARPATTRITTKYTVLPHTMPKSKANSITPSATQQPKKACLVLKTYDPASGTCIKYRTDKAAEVGRLIAALGTCGRVMAALPEKEEKEEEEKEVEERVGAGVADAKGKAEATEVQGGRGGDHKEGKGKAGGGGKKKKGKR